MKEVVLNIEGMSCEHCVNAVEGALKGVVGVAGAKVDLAAKSASVSYDETKTDIKVLKTAVEEQGFDVV